jgi:diguanylate cyclase (GGDEF)-like protein/PAS domain S-box-containing protein
MDITHNPLWHMLPVAVMVVRDGVIQHVNQACQVLFEADSAEQMVGHPTTEFVHPVDQQRSSGRIQRVASAPESGIPNKSTEIRIRTCKGQLRMALFTSVATEVDGLPSVLICGTDMTHQSEIQAQLRESEQHFRRLFENMRDVYYRTNAQGVVLHVGPGVRQVLGYDPQEIVGRTAESYYPQSSDRDAFKAAIQAHGAVSDFPGQMVRKDGRVIDISISSQAVFDDDGNFVGVEGIYRDITQRKNLERELHRMASTDTLTGMANRRVFLERSEAAFQLASTESQPLALLMLDLDHFKQINDHLGHLEGDRVLIAFAQAVQLLLRADDTVGRLGGEEFGVLLPGSGHDGALAIAERILQHIRDLSLPSPHGQPVQVTTSIGLACQLPTDRSLRDLLDRADQALYQAKRQGRDRCACA